MVSIHRVILRRLLAAWLLVSIGIGAGVYYLETGKIDDYVVALATAEAAQFSGEGLGHGQHTSEQLADLQQRARDFARRNFVVIALYDRDGNPLVQVINPRHVAIEAALNLQLQAFPRDAGSHYRKYKAAGRSVVQVRTPLTGGAGGVTGYFEGAFLVSEEIIANLRHQVMRTLAVVLIAILLTAVVFYPVILGLNRHLIRASRDILKGNLEVAAALGEAIAKRDWDTGEHNFRVTLYAIRLGEAVGIQGVGMRHLILGAFLHDVGKIGISDTILLKRGPLSAAEMAVMRTHVALGVDIIGKSEWLRGARNVIAYHHERFDGSGYLEGLAGDAIPLNARIFAVVDVFDALTSKRPYKAPWPVQDALRKMEAEAGRHFDPQLLAHFRDIAPALHADIGQAGESELMARLRGQMIRYFLPAPASNRG